MSIQAPAFKDAALQSMSPSGITSTVYERTCSSDETKRSNWKRTCSLPLEILELLTFGHSVACSPGQLDEDILLFGPETATERLALCCLTQLGMSSSSTLKQAAAL